MAARNLSEFSTSELLAEIEKREDSGWPRHATIEIDYPWDDIDVDCISEQLGWDMYNEDVRSEKIQELDLPGYLKITIQLQRSGEVKIVAFNGKKISDEPFEIK